VIARLRALLKRSGHDATVTVGDLRLDPVAYGATGSRGAATLTPTEFRLLATLAAGRGTIVRRAELLRAGWPEGAIVHDNTLDVYIGRLRRHLRAVTEVSSIATVHGVGYRFE
jgi:two-component system response regulator MprA